MLEPRIESLSIDIGGVSASLFTRVWNPDGQEGAVFCIHGFTDNGSDFAYLASMFARSGYKVVVPDLIGRGRSTFLGDNAFYTPQNYFRCLSALNRYRGARNVYIGSSWGAMILLLFLAATKTAADAVVLNDPVLESGPAFDEIQGRIEDESRKIFATVDAARQHIVETRPSLRVLPGPLLGHYFRNKIVKAGEQFRIAYDPAVTNPYARRSFSLYDMLGKVPGEVLVTYGEDSPFRNRAELARVCAERHNVHFVDDLAGEHPPLLMDFHQALVLLGFVDFARKQIRAGVDLQQH